MTCNMLCCPEDAEEIEVPFKGTGGEVKLLIVALNYSYVEGAELTSTKDAKTVYRLADRCGVDAISVVTDKRGVGSPSFPTKPVVLRYIKEVAQSCSPGDWFVWFFAGHGISVPDKNGDEADGMDEAFVVPSKSGKVSTRAALYDDEFCRALDTWIPDDVRILCICDCCHSGTICDIDSYRFRHEIYQISAAQDHQESEDTGKGGALSIALRRATRMLACAHGNEEYSIQALYDLTLVEARKITKEQELSFQFSGTSPTQVAWPLCHSWTQYLVKPHFFDWLTGRDLRDHMDILDEASDAESVAGVGTSPLDGAITLMQPAAAIPGPQQQQQQQRVFLQPQGQSQVQPQLFAMAPGFPAAAAPNPAFAHHQALYGFQAATRAPQDRGEVQTRHLDLADSDDSGDTAEQEEALRLMRESGQVPGRRRTTQRTGMRRW